MKIIILFLIIFISSFIIINRNIENADFGENINNITNYINDLQTKIDEWIQNNINNQKIIAEKIKKIYF